VAQGGVRVSWQNWGNRLDTLPVVRKKGEPRGKLGCEACPNLLQDCLVASQKKNHLGEEDRRLSRSGDRQNIVEQ